MQLSNGSSTITRADRSINKANATLPELCWQSARDALLITIKTTQITVIIKWTTLRALAATYEHTILDASWFKFIVPITVNSIDGEEVRHSSWLGVVHGLDKRSAQQNHS